MFPKITFITGNKNKLAQVQKFISTPLEYKDLDHPEIQSLELQEIVKHKAIQAFLAVGQAVLIEDVSLVIHSLGMLPGPFIKWFLKELKPEGICELLANQKDRSATAEVCFCYYDGQTFQTFSGTINGTVASHAAGDNGFGWDRLFIPEGFAQTRAEMSEADSDKTNPRKFALVKFEDFLTKKYHLDIA